MTTLVKQPSEVRTYRMDFRRSLDRDDFISGVLSVSVTPGTITVDNPSSAEKTVSFRVSGGIDGESYNIKVIVSTSLGQTIEGDGLLVVREYL